MTSGSVSSVPTIGRVGDKLSTSFAESSRSRGSCSAHVESNLRDSRRNSGRGTRALRSPAAGKPTRPSCPSIAPAQTLDRNQGVRCDPGQEGIGWKAKTLRFEGGRVRRDPISHGFDVFAWDEHGKVSRCSPRGSVYRTALRGDDVCAARQRRPASAGRRKGLSEFYDLSCLGAPRWNPAHETALAQNRNAFHRRRSDINGAFSGMQHCNSNPMTFGGNADANSPSRRTAATRPVSACGRLQHTRSAPVHRASPMANKR
eukprot:TRINITY_DN70037_c0_g1_i1.p1 TRINITY_DN70037_c0_g1~~TRINITY_DN70037_c0_g1_i1.p1  ORF type:complete len:303 (+),score=26.97 TRINITY_DN70037_c0_g1_i1:134-910(+)